MIKKAETEYRDVFDKDSIRYESAEKYLDNWRTINNFKSVEELFAGQTELTDLLKKCLQIDPNRRINCKTAL